MAGKPLNLDRALIVKLSEIHCSIEEIAYICGCSRDTIERKWSDAVHEGRAKGKERLRRAQWKTAMSGNATMQIWLGKQILGQRDFKTDLAELTDEALAAEIKRRMANAPTGT